MAAQRRILVVDDDPWIAKMLEFVASDAGHVAVVCKDGQDAIEKFSQVMPDLVLLDVVLPKLDGLKVCEHIKKTPIGRLTPVLVFSGIYRDSTEAVKFGADAFIAKPFTPQQIGQQIKQMLPLQPEAPADAGPAPRPGPNETSLGVEPLPKALGKLHKTQLTGVLTLKSNLGIKYVFIEKGNVVQVRSPSTAAGVTTALLARGRVTASQLEDLQRKSRESGGKKILSQLLVEANLVRPDEMRKLVLSQMLHELFEVFRWRDGVHGFAESPPLPASAGQFKLDVQTPQLIQWGVRKMDPKLEDLDALVPTRMTFLARVPDASDVLKGVQLTDRERGILGLIDGTKTLQEIVGIADLAGTDAVPTLYTLMSIGAVVPSASSPPRAEAAHAQSQETRALQGPFAIAIMELWRNRETGVLRCVGPLDNRAVYVSRGVPVFARSERNADRLDQMLVRQGVITPEQAQKSLELQAKTPSRRVGQILLEMGAIGFEQLHATIKAQVQNLVLSLFTWTDGKYVFEPGALPTNEAITLDWDTPGAVLQGLRGLPLNYIRPMAPPRDAVVERAPDDGLLADLQLNSAEQKLLALLVGRHPMEQLLALDFIAHEALLRGLVIFAALGLVTVHTRALPLEEEHPHADEPGEEIDPLPPEPQPPAPAPENSWPDPVPRETEPPPAWTAPPEQKPSWLSGPALQAFEAEQTEPPPAAPEEEGVFNFAPPVAEAPPTYPPPSWQQGDVVPRAVYDALLAEKHELQQRLFALLEERRSDATVPRELFDQVQQEKRELQDKYMRLVDEMLRLRSEHPRGELRSFPGGKKSE